jgi:uncharacterized protein YkwD
MAVEVIELVNNYRSEHGCPPVILNEQLTTAAQAHSEAMALNDFVSHNGLNGSSPLDRMLEAGYQPGLWAENIGFGDSTPAALVNGLLQDTGHRTNILNCALRDIGIGYYYLPNDTGKVNFVYYWTQLMAVP